MDKIYRNIRKPRIYAGCINRISKNINAYHLPYRGALCALNQHCPRTAKRVEHAGIFREKRRALLVTKICERHAKRRIERAHPRRNRFLPVGKPVVTKRKKFD